MSETVQIGAAPAGGPPTEKKPGEEGWRFFCPACGEVAPIGTRLDAAPAPCGCGVTNQLTMTGVKTEGTPNKDWAKNKVAKERAERLAAALAEAERAKTTCLACGQPLPHKEGA